MSTTTNTALTYAGSITFYPSDVSRLKLDTDTHGMSNHVYVYKEPEGSFQVLAPQYNSGGTLCYGDMAGIKITSGHNDGQTINAKNVEDYLAWQHEESFPQEEVIDLLQAVIDAAKECEDEGASAWFKCIFSKVGELFKLMAAATSVKQYLYQFPIMLRPGRWDGLTDGGAIESGSTVQFLTLKTSISDADMDMAIGGYWLCLTFLSALRSGQHPDLVARLQASKDIGVPLPDPTNISALGLLNFVAPDLYQTLIGSPHVYSFKSGDSDDKKGWLRQQPLPDSNMIQSFVVTT
ncbi:MAG: hypothetical protein AAF799_05725 [Myxococcota bacterium]